MIVTGIAVSLIAILLGFGTFVQRLPQTIPLMQVLDDRFKFNLGSSFDGLRKTISESNIPIIEAPSSTPIREVNSATFLIDLVRIGYSHARLQKFRIVSALYEHRYDKLAEFVNQITLWQLLMVLAGVWLVTAITFFSCVINSNEEPKSSDKPTENPSEWHLDNKKTEYSNLLVPDNTSAKSNAEAQDNALGLDIDKSELPVQSTITKSELAEPSFVQEDVYQTPQIFLPNENKESDNVSEDKEVNAVDIDDSASIHSSSTLESQKWQEPEDTYKRISSYSTQSQDFEHENLFTKLETEEAPAMETPTKQNETTLPDSNKSQRSQRSQKAKEIVRKVSRTPSKMMKRMSSNGGSGSTSGGLKNANAFTVLDNDVNS
ncbi:hypothetical protein E3Q11_00611 [Wallemia mellicola]|nr:hypothetical protein E3Q11_00611 [Wallemia mellicola]